jgi:predicted molibdopterin-dependent oxidoreductase YjgC
MRSLHRGLQASCDPQITQERRGMKTIQLKIDGVETEAEDRTTILNIAQKLGIEIPTLCHHPLLEPYGVCRICTVEVRSGKRTRMVTACNYPATNGIEISTNSPRVRRDRKMIIEWMIARCGHVDILEDLAAEYDISEPRFGREGTDCILCGLCVHVCSEIVGANVLGFFNRGATREVSTAFGEASEKCIACGACTWICPTNYIIMETETLERFRNLPGNERLCRYSLMGVTEGALCANSFRCEKCEVEQRFQDQLQTHPIFLGRSSKMKEIDNYMDQLKEMRG